jgi:hypothetical protein
MVVDPVKGCSMRNGALGVCQNTDAKRDRDVTRFSFLDIPVERIPYSGQTKGQPTIQIKCVIVNKLLSVW